VQYQLTRVNEFFPFVPRPPWALKPTTTVKPAPAPPAGFRNFGKITGMGRPYAFAAALGLLLCSGIPAKGGEVSVSEFMENFQSLLEETPEPPVVTEAQLVLMEEGDLQTYIFQHGAKARPPAPVRLGGDGRLALARPDSGERIISYYRNRDGTYNAAETAKIDRLMRCSLTGEETPVSLKLLEILDAVEDRFGGRGLILLSGYRTPMRNKTVPGSARRSLHMLGWAADIRVPGRSAAAVAKFAGKLKAGGVGYYRDAAFVHLDSGRGRRWEVGLPASPPPGSPAPPK